MRTFPLLALGFVACVPNLGDDVIECDCECTETTRSGENVTTRDVPGIFAGQCRIVESEENAQQFLDTCNSACPKKNSGPLPDNTTLSCLFFPEPLAGPAPPAPDSPFANARLTAQVCPQDKSDAYGVGFYGDPSNATAVSQADAQLQPRVIVDDCDVEVVGPPSVGVGTTLRGSVLRFDTIDVTGPDQVIQPFNNCTEGGVALSRMFARLVNGVSADYSSGTYTIPEGEARFLVNADIFGIHTVFEAVNGEDISGAYNESTGAFTMDGSVEDVFGLVVELGVSGSFSFTARPPVVDAGPDRLVECGPYLLDGLVADPDDDVEEVLWLVDKDSPGGVILVGNPVVTTLTLGTHEALLRAADSRRASAFDAAILTVVDTTPPQLTNFAYNGPVCLWPPQHDYAILEIGRDFTATVEDVCDPNAEMRLTSAQSSQPDDAEGDGSTTNDIVLFPDHVCLRTERQGGALEGRRYTVQLHAVDSSGNASDPVVDIVVGHDQRPETRCLENVEYVSEDDPRCDPNALEATPQPSSEPPAGSQGCAAASAASPLIVLLAAAARRRRR